MKQGSVRITFFMGTDLRTGRGTENVLFNLLKYRPNDFDVTIVETDLLDIQRIDDKDVSVYTEGCERIRIHRHVLRSKNFIYQSLVNIFFSPFKRDLRQALKEGKLELIKKTDIAYLFFNGYSRFFKDLNIPVICTSHTFNLGNNFRNKLLNRLYTRINYIINFKYINGFHALPKDELELQKMDVKYRMVLPNGVNAEKFVPELLADTEKIKFLFVGALIKEKGLDLLIPLIEKVKEENVEFHIVGGGPMESEVRKNGRIIYHGILSNEDLLKLYGSCDVFLYPSHSDAFPLVILEALSSGMYVLAGEYLKGSFDNFEEKYLEYLPMSVEAFYIRVEEIIADRKIIEHDRYEEHRLVETNYDWRIISEKFYDFMRQFQRESSTLK